MKRSGMREKNPGFSAAFAAVHPGYGFSRRRDKQTSAVHARIAGM
jgi:hypothetical protein